MAQPIGGTAPSLTFRLQRGFKGSGMHASSSPTLILQLTSSERVSANGSYSITVQSRSKAAFGKETENGITSANFDSSHGQVNEQDLNSMGILQALAKLETLPDGGHEVDSYNQGVQIYLFRPPSHEWWNGPAPGRSIAPNSASATSKPSEEDRATFASIVKTLEKLLTKATKGTGAGSMGSKRAEPDTADED